MAERLLDSLVVRLGFEVNNTTVNKIKNLLGNFSKQASKVVSSTEKISAGFQNISRSADRMPARLAQAGMSFEFLGRLNQRLQNIGKEKEIIKIENQILTVVNNITDNASKIIFGTPH